MIFFKKKNSLSFDCIEKKLRNLNFLNGRQYSVERSTRKSNKD